MPLLFAYGMCMGSAMMVGMIAYPFIEEAVIDYLQRKTDEATAHLNDIFMTFSRRTVWMLYVVMPIGIGVVVWLFTGRWTIGCVGTALGVFAPSFAVAQMQRNHRKRFDGQLIDGLLLLHASLWRPPLGWTIAGWKHGLILS